MNVELSGVAGEFVSQTVAAGEFDSPADAVEAAVMMLRESHDWVLEAHRDEIAAGLRAADEGRSISSTELFTRLRARIAARSPNTTTQ